MGRRRKGSDVTGWVIVDKPAGIGSTEVTARVRRAFDARKAGHAGTLDPAATGVLAVALGEATKTIPFVAEARKSYRFTVRLGAATTTDDAEGAVIATSASRPDDAAVRAALPAFTGAIRQVPPRVSAVHVGGRRAYDLAREGQDVALAPRPLTVERLELVARPDADHLELEMTCGKGGYVRSIARDLGERLGCLGHVEALRRVRSGPFAESEAVALDAVEAGPEAHLRPVELALAGVPCIEVAAGEAERLRHGNPVEVGAGNAEPAWAAFAGHVVAIGSVTDGTFRPSRVFVR